MLYSVSDIEHYSVCAQDGTIGQVTDCYFDDQRWAIRYLVTTVGEEDARRDVLISPISIRPDSWSGHLFQLNLTQQQLHDSPAVDTHKPVSRQQEMGFAGYYGYGRYWGGSGLWGAGLYPDVLQGGLQPRDEGNADSHLRSVNAVMRYYVHATDGDIGHVTGFLVDERSWAIRYIVVNTSNWWVGHEVILAPQRISAVSWLESMVSFDLTRASIKQAPPYAGGMTLDAASDAAMRSHYGRQPAVNELPYVR